MNKIKLNIQQKILLLIIITVFLSFFINYLLNIINTKRIINKAISYNKNIGESTAKITEDFSINQTKKYISSLAKEKARVIERSIYETKYDIDYISHSINHILSHPEQYKEIILPNHKDKEIHNGEAFIHYAPEIEPNNIKDELKHEIQISSNIADLLKNISNSYDDFDASVFIASRKGYMISALHRNNNFKIKFSEYSNDYDPRETIWYKEIEKHQKLMLTDYYQAVEGYLEVTFGTPYYDKDGFAGVAAVSISLESFNREINENKFNKKEINFALNDKGEIIASSEDSGMFEVLKSHIDLRKSNNPTIAKEATNMVSGKNDVALVSIKGKEYYLAYAPMLSIDWSFGILIEKEEVIKSAKEIKSLVLTQSESFENSLETYYKNHFYQIISALLIFLILLLALNIKYSQRYTNPIIELTASVKEIAKGNLDNQISIKTGDEVEELADSVNNMTIDLKSYMENLSRVTAEKERITTELNVARNIQASMLPNVDPDFSNKKEFDLAVYMNPAKEVGGDFYDFYMLDDKHLAITVADVSGKGVGAALFMSISKSILKNNAQIAYSDGKEPKLEAIIRQTNLQLNENNDEAMFVTVFFGVLDLNTGELIYVNAGHKTPLIRHKEDGKFNYVQDVKKSGIIGFSPITKYNEHKITLNAGDMLFLYTDGITEAMNSQRELFNENRLKVSLESIQDDSKASEILSTVYKAVNSFTSDAEQYDDITMLGLVYKGNE